MLKWGSAVVLLVLLASLIGYFSLRQTAIPVDLVSVKRGTVESTISNTRAGTIKACRRAKLSPPVGGQISHLYVQKGQRVKQGEVLLELWRDDLKAQRQLAQQQLLTAESRVNEVCSVAELKLQELNRAKELYSQQFISIEALQRAETEAKSKQAACQAVRSEISQSRSRIDAARASLEKMVLQAPFAGIVADISGEQGEYTTPSPPGIQTPAAIDLIDDGCVYVSAPIDEVDAARLRVGQTARISLDAMKGQYFEGKVKRIAPYVLELEKQARTVEVEVAFNQPVEHLLIGYSADVEIVTEVRNSVLYLPSQAIFEGHQVWQVVAGKLERRDLQLGLSNWELSEVQAGLKEGDQVVLSLDQANLAAGVAVMSRQP